MDLCSRLCCLTSTTSTPISLSTPSPSTQVYADLNITLAHHGSHPFLGRAGMAYTFDPLVRLLGVCGGVYCSLSGWLVELQFEMVWTAAGVHLSQLATNSHCLLLL